MKIRYNTKREWENKINEFRVYDGMSVKELAIRTNSSVQTIFTASTGMANPRNRNGKLKRWTVELLRVFNCEFYELFPFEQCEIRRYELTEDQQVRITTSEFTYRSNDIIEIRILGGILRKIIGTLDKRERRVIYLKFFKNFNFDEIGKSMGFTNTRATQIHNRALRKLRHPIRSVLLKGWEP